MLSTATPTWSIAVSIAPGGWRRPAGGSGELTEAPASGRASSPNLLETGIGRVAAPDLRARPAVQQHDVGGEVVLPADQRRPDAIGVHRDAGGLELPDPLGVEAARGAD